MALEATILLPFFLAFILALAGFISTAKTEIAVQSAASETVKQLAHHYAPLDQLRKGLLDEGEERLRDIWKAMPPVLSQGMQQLVHHTEERVAESLFEPLLYHYAPDQLDPDRLYIQQVMLPKTDDQQQAYFSIEVVYEWSYPVPFLNIEQTIRKKAVERAWK